MSSKLVTARKYHLCSACGQLIVPGEVYRAQHWAPWEVKDGDGRYWSQPACRWCADQIWKTEGCWYVEEWASDEIHRWMRLAEADYTLPDAYWIPRPEFREPLRRAQREAAAFLRFLRRFTKGAKPATLRRVGPKLLDIAFKRAPEGSWEHLAYANYPGEEWWRCAGCRQHPCDCACPMPLAVRVLDAAEALLGEWREWDYCWDCNTYPVSARCQCGRDQGAVPL